MSLIQLLFPNEAMVAVGAVVDRWYSHHLFNDSTGTFLLGACPLLVQAVFHQTPFHMSVHGSIPVASRAL
jgi:hypothetical protein